MAQHDIQSNNLHKAMQKAVKGDPQNLTACIKLATIIKDYKQRHRKLVQQRNPIQAKINRLEAEVRDVKRRMGDSSASGPIGDRVETGSRLRALRTLIGKLSGILTVLDIVNKTSLQAKLNTLAAQEQQVRIQIERIDREIANISRWQTNAEDKYRREGCSSLPSMSFTVP